MKKGTKWIVSGVILLIILSALGLTGYLQKAWYYFQEPLNCEDQPNNYYCVCETGEMKQNDGITSGGPFRCESLPEIVTVSFPLETWEEAYSYAVERMGGFPCEGDFYWDSQLEGEIYKQCDKYGSAITTTPKKYLGHMISLECKHFLIADSGEVAWGMRIDPNEEFIYEWFCYPDRGDIICPEGATGIMNFKEEPATTCGDGCCHSGENWATCPEDCEAPIEGLCETSAITGYVGSGSGAYETYCENIDGVVKTTGVTLYPDSQCDKKQKICELDGNEVLRWRVQPDCSESFIGHSLMEEDSFGVCTDGYYTDPNPDLCTEEELSAWIGNSDRGEELCTMLSGTWHYAGSWSQSYPPMPCTAKKWYCKDSESNILFNFQYGLDCEWKITSENIEESVVGVC